MIFYRTNVKEVTHTILQCVSKGYDLAFLMTCESRSSAQSILEKWNERYELTLSNQQQYRKFLCGESTFCCIVADVGYQRRNFGDAEFYRYLKNKTDENSPVQLSQKISLVLLCRVNPTLLSDEESANKYKNIDAINDKLAKKIAGCERFSKPHMQFGAYEFVQITKRAKSLKELQEQGLTENSKHSTDFTYRLSSDKVAEIRARGVQYVNSYQNKTNSPAPAHFEKYLRELEGYIGYRGVRVQIGELYNAFTRYFKAKMTKTFASAGGRKLNLSYVKADSPKIENNMGIDQYFRKIKDDAKTAARAALQNWKSSPAGQELLKSKSMDGYIHDDAYYAKLEQ
jgi:hypothetical protein